MARVVLINPPLSLDIDCGPPGVLVDPKMPMGLLYLASSLRKSGHRVKIVDAAGLGLDGATIIKKVKQFSPDYVGLSCVTANVGAVFGLARHTKESLGKEIKVILGGVHATLAPETCLQETSVDYVVVGEGEYVLPQLCRRDFILEKIPGVFYRKDGNVVTTGKPQRIRDLDSLPFPAYDLLPLDAYWKQRKEICIIASRGCPYSCSFCCGPKIWNRSVIFRSPDSVISEINYYKEHYPETEVFHFLDDNFTTWRKGLVEFCDKITPLHIHWRCIGRIEHLTFDVIQNMASAGCTMISFGVESGSARIQAQTGKRVPLDIIPEKVEMLSSMRIRTKAFFMFGFPGETKDEIFKTIQYALKLRSRGLKDAVFLPLIPYVGTQLYNDLCSERPSEFGQATFAKDWNHRNPNISAHLAKYRSFPTDSAHQELRGIQLRNIATLAYETFYHHDCISDSEYIRNQIDEIFTLVH